ncbi:MAG TPA: class I SAM-dependent methyltransferase [bacterium]|nr:class I SAM-dependent methyltransferase [bacterium]
MTADTTCKSLMGLYRKERFLARFHVRTRYRRALYDELLGYVPESGSILDIGCGHGVFANLCALTSAARDITGIDVSGDKIAVAKRTIGARRNVHFQIADALHYIPRNTPDVILCMDTMYLIPFDLQETMLSVFSERLAADGLLMINEVCRDRSFGFRKAMLQEYVSVRILRITSGDGLYYRSVQEWTGLLEERGFSVRVIKRHTPNPTHLFLCRKKHG